MFKWHLLVAAALMVAATDVSAAVNVKQAADGTYYNAQTMQKTDAAGNVLGAEAFPDRETYRVGSTRIIGGTYATAAMDSCAPIDMHQYKNPQLLIEMPAAGASRIAVQIRYHIDGTSDTTSYFPWVPLSLGTSGISYVSVGDSVITSTAFGTATAPGGDEFLSILARSNSSSPTIPGRYAKKFYALPAWFQYMSVRIRVMGGPSATATPINVYLVGSAN